MLATPFLVSPRARGVLPCLKGAAAAGPPHAQPAPPTPASEARTGSAGPLLPRLCPPVGLRPLRRGDRAVIRFCQVGGGSSPPQARPPSSDLSAPLRGAVPACQLIWPQSSPGRGGSGPPGVEGGWGPPDKQAPSLCAEAGAGGRGLCPRRLGRGRMAAGAGRAVRTARTDAGVGRRCPGCWGWVGGEGVETAGQAPALSGGLSLPSCGRGPGAGFRLTARVRWAPGSLNETANLLARDYIKESPPPAAPRGVAGEGVGEGRAGLLFSRLSKFPHPTAGHWAGRGPGPGRLGPAVRSRKGLRGSGGAEVESGEALAQPNFFFSPCPFLPLPPWSWERSGGGTGEGEEGDER